MTQALACYIIMQPCVDTYYPGHPTGEVFTDDQAASARLRELNGPEPDDDAPFSKQWWDHAYYIQTGELK